MATHRILTKVYFKGVGKQRLCSLKIRSKLFFLRIVYSSDGVYLFDMGSSEYKFSMNQSVGNFALDNFTLVHKTFKSVI